MYEKTYGAKYHKLHELTGKDYASAADIAKLIRADIKDAVRRGELPSEFAGHEVTYAVTVENYSMGRSIDISIRGIPEAARRAMRIDDRWGHEIEVDTADARALKAKLDGYLNAYNYDGSDIMTDYFNVNYYGHAEFESEWAAKERAKKAARAKELKANPKPKRVSKRELLAHMREHGRYYRDTIRIDTLLLIHAHAHKGDAGHAHEDGDVLLPIKAAA